MSSLLNSLLDKHKILLAAHRGVCGGNIPCNTLEAYQIAFLQGADIVEVDVESSSDGKLFIQHPNMEPVHLGIKDSIRNHNSSELVTMARMNQDMTPTAYKIARFEEVLDLLRGKCLINVDKFWGNPEKISSLIRERSMEDQIIVKTKLEKMDVSLVEELARGLLFMPVVHHEDDSLELFKGKDIRHVGTEAIFTDDSDPIAQPEYVERMHEAGKIVWVNPIIYNYKEQLVGGHSDDTSILGNPENGWGWLADRGFDVLQTDWLMACDNFLRTTKRRN